MKQEIKAQRSAAVRAGLTMLAIVVAGVAASSHIAYAQTLTTLVNFNGEYGALPSSRLIADASGNLFGTTQERGFSGKGTVFEVMKTATGYATTPTVLFSFDGTHGAYPQAGLVADANGNLFGTTRYGGAFDQGTVFEIAKTSTGYASTATVLVNFNRANGAEPVAALILDAEGNLFGTTLTGGSFNAGTVFEVVKTATGYSSTPTVLVNLGGNSGAYPFGGLLADAQGNLFGTASGAGTQNVGTVFEVVRTSTGYASTPSILFNFDAIHGANPFAGLIADRDGNLFGTTLMGGTDNGGTVFEIVKTGAGYASIPTVLVNFDGQNGLFPLSDLLADATGSLFGTTNGYPGGIAGSPGEVFKVVKTAGGFASSPTVLYTFHGSDGASPMAGLIADRSGNLFGTTLGGGTGGAGTVFELSGTGFVPPVLFAGVPGTANCKGASTAALAQTYGGMAAAAKALGYSSVADLQAAIGVYCGR